MKSKAQTSVVPYKLAGRESRDDAPHPMWELFSEAKGQRVYYLTVAANMIKDENVVVDPGDEKTMDQNLKDAARRKITSTNPVALNKRIRQLERELQHERSKRAKLDLGTSSDSETSTSSENMSTTDPVDPQTALKELVATLKAERKNATFPRICLSALPELTR